MDLFLHMGHFFLHMVSLYCTHGPFLAHMMSFFLHMVSLFLHMGHFLHMVSLFFTLLYVDLPKLYFIFILILFKKIAEYFLKFLLLDFLLRKCIDKLQIIKVTITIINIITIIFKKDIVSKNYDWLIFFVKSIVLNSTKA